MYDGLFEAVGVDDKKCCVLKDKDGKLLGRHVPNVGWVRLIMLPQSVEAVRMSLVALLVSSILLASIYRNPLKQGFSLTENGGCDELLQNGWLWRPEQPQYVWQPCKFHRN